MSDKRAKHQKSAVRINLEYLPFLLLYRLLHRLTLKQAYHLSAALFALLYWVDGKHRRRAIDHVLHAGIAADRRAAARLARKSFREFSKLLVEIVKMDQCYDPAKIRVAGSIAGIDLALSQDHPNHNVIIVTAHYGNWEVAGTAFSDKARLRMLSIMRPFGNPKIGELILNHRRSTVHEVVDKANGLRPILKALQAGKNVSILIDQHASSNEGVETVYFGQPCRTHKTPALLHLKTGIPILPEVTRRVGDNFEFELVLGDPIVYTPTGDKEHDVQAVTQLCTTALEKLIAECPEQWLWAPRRWLNINRPARR